MRRLYRAITTAILLAATSGLWATSVAANAGQRFKPIEVFDLEYATDPQIAPDGKHVVYVRNFMDIMRDRRRSNLWIVDIESGDHRPITTGNTNEASPRWSPDGSRLLYLARVDGSTQLFVRWMDTGQTAKLTNLTESARDIAWSPDGNMIAFTMRVPAEGSPFAEMPAKPKGARWARPVRVVDKLIYRVDGQGFLEDGYTQVFVLSAEGGTPRQLTRGPYNHDGTLAWSADGNTLVFSANRHEDWEYDPLNSELYEVSLEDGTVNALTARQGPDNNPRISPDGSRIAYAGYDDTGQSYRVARLYVMERSSGESRVLTEQLDREILDAQWDSRGRGLYVRYDDLGNTNLAFVPLKGDIEIIARDMGGTSLGRPYSGGSFSVGLDGTVAYTSTDPYHPADVATAGRRTATRRLTRLNEDLLAHKELGRVEEIWYTSAHDGRRVQGWVVTPPGFDAGTRYPLILEIHGGPFANYGPRFAAELQLYAAAGYVVLYINPRGSTGYGEEFGNLIHHAYPGKDYDDLMSGVDEVLKLGFVDEDQLFVTGGSGGGVLTSWIVGKTDRFRAAVVAKPVINWTSFVLTADLYNFFYKYWFPGFPWDHPDAYLSRSPLSLVGNVSTPTMILTGEADYRTPMSESEQYYQALKLRKVDTALVRVPGASHGIAQRPSNLIAKVVNILAWFDKYRERP